jgi:hypothetical protein
MVVVRGQIPVEFSSNTSFHLHLLKTRTASPPPLPPLPVSFLGMPTSAATDPHEHARCQTPPHPTPPHPACALLCRRASHGGEQRRGADSWTSTRETTPAVTQRLSPPVGKPTTTTLCCSSGTCPNSSAHVPTQKSSSSTLSTARSHSCPTAITCQPPSRIREFVHDGLASAHLGGVFLRDAVPLHKYPVLVRDVVRVCQNSAIRNDEAASSPLYIRMNAGNLIQISGR